MKVVKPPLCGRKHEEENKAKSPVGCELKRVGEIQRPLMPACYLYLSDPSHPAEEERNFHLLRKHSWTGLSIHYVAWSSLQPCEISNDYALFIDEKTEARDIDQLMLE